MFAAGAAVIGAWPLRLESPLSPPRVEDQDFTCPCTPSDSRAYQNMRADLARKDNGVLRVFLWSEERVDGSALLALQEHELQQQRKELERTIESKQQELAGVELELAKVKSEIDS